MHDFHANSQALNQQTQLGLSLFYKRQYLTGQEFVHVDYWPIVFDLLKNAYYDHKAKAKATRVGYIDVFRGKNLKTDK